MNFSFFFFLDLRDFDSSKINTHTLYMPMVLGLPKAHHHNLSMKALTIAQMRTGLFVEFFVHAGIFGKFQMAKLSAKFIMKSCNSP